MNISTSIPLFLPKPTAVPREDEVISADTLRARFVDFLEGGGSKDELVDGFDQFLSYVGMSQDCSTVAFLRQYIGQQIVFLCARYTYWGILSQILDGQTPAAVLSFPISVEQSGPSQGSSPLSIDIIGKDIMIFLDAAEVMLQPPWSQNSKLPSIPDNCGFDWVRIQEEMRRRQKGEPSL